MLCPEAHALLKVKVGKRIPDTNESLKGKSLVCLDAG